MSPVAAIGRAGLNPLGESNAGGPFGEQGSILCGRSRVRGGTLQVSRAGNAGKPDNEDEYRHRIPARAMTFERSRAKSSFQFHGTLSRCRSGTATPPSRICHAALARGGCEPPAPPDWRLAHLAAATSPGRPDARVAPRTGGLGDLCGWRWPPCPSRWLWPLSSSPWSCSWLTAPVARMVARPRPGSRSARRRRALDQHHGSGQAQQQPGAQRPP